MISVKIDKKKEIVRYSTFIKVEEKFISISITRYLYYAKPYQLDHSLSLPKELIDKGITLFEDLFLWPLDFYTNPNRNHFSYHRFIDTNFYYKSEKHYELQWCIIEANLNVKNKSMLTILNPTINKSHIIAIPPSGKERIDYITYDLDYKFDCNKGDFCGIEIIVDKNENKINFISQN